MTYRIWIPVYGGLVLAVAAFVLLSAGPAGAAEESSGWGPGTAAMGTTQLVEAAHRGDVRGPTLRAVPAADSDDHGFMDNDWWVVMPIMMVIFWGGVIIVAVWGVRQFTRSQNRSPLDVAKERLAKGEMSKEEFDRMRDDLA